MIQTTYVAGNKCHIYCCAKSCRILPVFYWGIAFGNIETVEKTVSYLKQKIGETSFLLAAFEADNWNDDFSPWMSGAVIGEDGFGGRAQQTLTWLCEAYIPYIEAAGAGYMKAEQKVLRFLAGYSLAGLFSIWAYFESSMFDGAVICSGSLWYPGWSEYVQAYADCICKKRQQYVYLSLGKKEERTRNAQVAVVGENTRKLYYLLSQRQDVFACVLEWNTGGHFSEPEIRMAKGIYWILQKMQEYFSKN